MKRTCLISASVGVLSFGGACRSSEGGSDPPDLDCVAGATFQVQGMVGTTSLSVASDFGSGNLQNADPEFGDPGYLDVNVLPAIGSSIRVRLEFDDFLPINGGDVAAWGFVADTAGGIAGNCAGGGLSSRVWLLDVSDESGAVEYRWELRDLHAPPDYCTGAALGGAVAGCWLEPDAG